jgi:hypothetical protein
MLNSAFTFALEEFANCETQIHFHAPLMAVSSALNEGYFKWEMNGLGEAFGFWFRLKSNKQVFIVKTLVNTNNLDPHEIIEWHIDAHDTQTAMLAFEGLNLGDSVTIDWKRS